MDQIAWNREHSRNKRNLVSKKKKENLIKKKRKLDFGFVVGFFSPSK
jgi:hypothetical protein